LSGFVIGHGSSFGCTGVTLPLVTSDFEGVIVSSEIEFAPLANKKSHHGLTRINAD
jgi:hypothetical protein